MCFQTALFLNTQINVKFPRNQCDFLQSFHVLHIFLAYFLSPFRPVILAKCISKPFSVSDSLCTSSTAVLQAWYLFVGEAKMLSWHRRNLCPEEFKD